MLHLQLAGINLSYVIILILVSLNHNHNVLQIFPKYDDVVNPIKSLLNCMQSTSYIDGLDNRILNNFLTNLCTDEADKMLFDCYIVSFIPLPVCVLTCSCYYIERIILSKYEDAVNQVNSLLSRMHGSSYIDGLDN